MVEVARGKSYLERSPPDPASVSERNRASALLRFRSRRSGTMPDTGASAWHGFPRGVEAPAASVPMPRFASLVLAAVLAVPALAAPVDIDVERVSFNASADGLVARVHTSSRVRAYSVDQEAGTLSVVLYQARVARSLRREGARQPVRDYRVEGDGDRVTVQFDIDPAYGVRAYPDRDSDDLLIAFSAQPRPRTSTWGSSAPSMPVPTAGTPEVSSPTPGQGPLAPGADRLRLDTIVLDAGHGGHDAGGVGIGITDRDAALAVITRLGPMIERELGIHVVYTRNTNTFVELRERGRIANRSGGKLFISVHGNSGPSSASGTETFFLAPRGAGNARSVMERENSVIELESDPSLYADFHNEDDILASLAMSAYQEESQHLARLIESEFRSDGRRSRGVKQDNFIVLWAASMPAVLVEVGFVTNPDEARFLSSSDGQERTARAIFNAIRAYRDTYERGLRLSSAEG